MLYILIISVILIIVANPADAVAWGPATHLELGRDIVNQLNLLIPNVRSIIGMFPNDYLYGNIIADVVFAKNLSRELAHCHNWTVAFNLMKKSDTDARRSFAYGYLSHLAADTIAHNIFIPEKMVRSFTTRIHRHIYWELRFDALVDKTVWRIPKKISRDVHWENDRLLDSVLHDTILSFRTNKVIFNSIILLNRMERWHRMIDLLSSRSRWKLKKNERIIYYKLSFDSMLSLLNEGDAALCLKDDPRGRNNMYIARDTRKRLKRLKKRGEDWMTVMDRALKKMTYTSFNR